MLCDFLNRLVTIEVNQFCDYFLSEAINRPKKLEMSIHTENLYKMVKKSERFKDKKCNNRHSASTKISINISHLKGFLAFPNNDIFFLYNTICTTVMK